MIVIAGPGTGKPLSSPFELLIFCVKPTRSQKTFWHPFTESGAFDAQKLLEIVGASAYRIPIHTFHSFCNEIIKNFPKNFLESLVHSM